MNTDQALDVHLLVSTLLSRVLSDVNTEAGSSEQVRVCALRATRYKKRYRVKK